MKKPKAYSYIRFSSEAQKLGDSLNRQTRLSNEYVSKHGLELDTSLSMQDLGISAYSGKNISEGALGAFLEAIENGKVDRGSYLLVESLDRLSRQDVFTAMRLFMDILDKGIIIVTLMDGVKYDKESVSKNSHQLIISLTIMQRANEESETKSKRLKHSWKTKRENAKVKPITSKCPAWLKYDKSTDSFIEITERVKLLKKFFEWTIKGYGNTSIQSKLNGEKVPTWGKSKGWHTSYLQKIFNNRCVLGEFQLHKMENGKQVKVGEPIQNYYPQVIDEETFYLAQNARNNRKLKGGRRGSKFKNLFTNLLKCGYCGSPIRFVDKGKGPKGGTYLNCSNGIRNMGCYKVGWQYKSFEKSALTFIEKVDIDSLFEEEETSNQISELNKQLTVNEEKLSHLSSKSKNLINAIENGVELPDIKEISSKLTNEIKSYKAKSKSIKNKLSKLSNQKETTSKKLEDVIRLIADNSNEFDDKKLHGIRRSLNQKMQEIIDVIFIFNVGSPFTKEMYDEQIAIIENSKKRNVKEAKLFFDKKLENSINPKDRFFFVLFKNKLTQIVRPDFESPEKIEFMKNTFGEVFLDGSNQDLKNLEDIGLEEDDINELNEFLNFDFSQEK